jgi:hypothetical protein
MSSTRSHAVGATGASGSCCPAPRVGGIRFAEGHLASIPVVDGLLLRRRILRIRLDSLGPGTPPD